MSNVIAFGSTDIKGRSQNSYTGPWKTVVSHGLKLGVFGFLLTTHAKQMYSQCSPTVWSFNGCVSSRSDRSRCKWHIGTWQTTVILITGKTWIEYPQFEPHAWIKMAQVLWSLVYSPEKWLHNRIYCPSNRSKQIKETHTAYSAGTQYTLQSLNEKQRTWLHSR